jgi:hypothetical protein
MTERRKDALVVALLAVAAAALFRDARIGIPRADQLYFLKEHDRLPAAWDFFWNAVSYNRANSRVALVGTGDHFLFRPLFGATIAGVEILGRGSLVVAGTVGIAFHWVACASLYLVTRRWAGRALAAAGAFVMAASFTGLDAVAWTHIDPYLLALALLAFGVSSVGEDRSVRAAVLLLLSAWIHETALFALLAAALFARRGAYWGALAAYAAADALDLLIHPWSSVAHAFTERVPGYFPGPATIDLLRVAGLAVLGRVAPGAVDLRLVDAPWDRALWPVAQVPDLAVLPLGILAWLAIAGLAALALRSPEPRRSQGLALALVWASIPSSLVALRFSVRTIRYLGISTYYFYLLDYVAILAALWLAAGVRRSRATAALAAAAALGLAIPAAARVQRVLADRAPFVSDVHDLAAAVARGLEPGECYGGPLDGALAALHPPTAPLVLLRDAACAGDERRPVYLATRADGYALVALSEAHDGATEALTEVALRDGASVGTRTANGERVVIRYERGTWSTGDAAMWHVSADGTVRAGFRRVLDRWYAVVDDRVLTRVPELDPTAMATARHTFAERPLRRDP